MQGDRNVVQIKNWLTTVHKIKAPDDWIEEGLTWIRENIGQDIPNNARGLETLKAEVLKQWLHTDLRDLNFPIFPSNLSNQSQTVINCASFAVQYDISKPALSQLKQLTQTESDDAEVSAKPKEKEKKANRMLMLELSDGVQSLNAIEFQPIQHISIDVLVPGIKLLLQGTLSVRNGIIFLTKDNIKIVGGCVTDLMKENDQINVLNEALNNGQNGTNPQTLAAVDREEIDMVNMDVADINFDEDWDDFDEM